MDRSNIARIAKSEDDKILLAKIWDKINSAISKNIPGNTCFLSPRDLEMTKYLFGAVDGLFSFGGYDHAGRGSAL